MVIVGGEQQLTEEEMKVYSEAQGLKKAAKLAAKKKKGGDDEICVDLDNESSSESVSLCSNKFYRTKGSPQMKAMNKEMTRLSRRRTPSYSTMSGSLIP